MSIISPNLRRTTREHVKRNRTFILVKPVYGETKLIERKMPRDYRGERLWA